MIPSIRHIFTAIVAISTAQIATGSTIRNSQTGAILPAVTPDPQPPDILAVRNAATTAVAKTITVAASLPSTAPEYVSDQLFTSAILNSTNFFRREHNATAAIWNTTIAHFADEYLANDTDCTFAHSGGPYGENIAVGFQSVHGAVDAWGDERSLYNYNDPGFSEATGHFTQLVWKNSTTVGCGRKLCGGKADGEKSTGWFLVCEYWPRGNIIGQFAQEVGRQINGTGSGGDGEPSVAAGRPAVGVITAAIIVFLSLAAAFVNDMRLTLADET
ncbi:hypothetical protein SEUCBS140593_001014 [Sporothrix eucalyptigena]|uniref:SCP domain-containing protein n=1 Tax=Sporothrix eucalyptigena TaxID=1812306 RepID=A0ABP0AUP1_9PEZI